MGDNIFMNYSLTNRIKVTSDTLRFTFACQDIYNAAKQNFREFYARGVLAAKLKPAGLMRSDFPSLTYSTHIVLRDYVEQLYIKTLSLIMMLAVATRL